MNLTVGTQPRPDMTGLSTVRQSTSSRSYGPQLSGSKSFAAVAWHRRAQDLCATLCTTYLQPPQPT